jgi:hypothetical protein
MSLERLYLAAWLDGLEQRTPQPAVRRVAALAELTRLDDTGRAPYVPLRPAQRHLRSVDDE